MSLWGYPINLFNLSKYRFIHTICTACLILKKTINKLLLNL
jgi:hypothetical protein